MNKYLGYLEFLKIHFRIVHMKVATGHAFTYLFIDP